MQIAFIQTLGAVVAITGTNENKETPT